MKNRKGKYANKENVISKPFVVEKFGSVSLLVIKRGPFHKQGFLPLSFPVYFF